MNSPAEIARLYVDTGVQKSKLPIGKMFGLAIFAGMFIALGGFASTVASYGIPIAALGRILSALVFPIGLMMVLVGGAELFTGNSLMIMPVFQKRASLGRVLINWLIVYIGNFVGSLAIAWVAANFFATGDHALYNGALADTMIKTTVSKSTMGFLDAFVKGILCNFMVCMAVWVSMAASELAGKISALYLPIALFVLCGFEHCVANMYFLPAGLFVSLKTGAGLGVSIVDMLLKNMLPVTLGNITGGAVITGFGYWWIYLRGHAE